MEPDDVKLLYVSDDPESFAGHGRLFSAKLPTDGRAVRILFDHVNQTTDPARVALRVIVALVNVSEGTTGKVLVAGRDAGPRDPLLAGADHVDVHDANNGMLVGHVATAEFLKVRLIADDHGESEVSIAFGQPHVLASRVLQPPAAGNVKNVGECVAGIFDVQPIDQDISYELRVMAVDPSSNASAWDAPLPRAKNAKPPAKNAKLPAKNVKVAVPRSGVFNIDGSTSPITIPFGGTANYGKTTYPRAQPLDGDTNPAHIHQGEYGVFKHFRCELGEGQSGFLYQSTGAPGATATYVLDDGTVLTSTRFAPGEPPDKLVELKAPSLNVTTMAEINSSLWVVLTTGPNRTDLADAGAPGSKITVA